MAVKQLIVQFSADFGAGRGRPDGLAPRLNGRACSKAGRRS